MNSISQRESQFELLRIIAQWMIVVFHLLLMFTKNYQLNHPYLSRNTNTTSYRSYSICIDKWIFWN